MQPEAATKATAVINLLASRLQRWSLSIAWRKLPAVFICGIALLIAWRSGAPWFAQAGLLFLLLVVCLQAVWPKDGLQVLGPLLWYDLALLARRSRTRQLRCLYGLGLLAWLCVAFHEQFPNESWVGQFLNQGASLPIRDWSDFAFRCFLALLAVETVATFVITPVYLASAVAEERERGTLDFLFATPLRDREIILGKLFGRLAHLVSILLVALPILCLTRLWGGVDGVMILATFVVAGMTLLSVGSIAMLCSVLAPNLLMAVLSSYALVACLAFLCFCLPTLTAATFPQAFESGFAQAVDAWQKLLGMPIPGLAPVIPPPDPMVYLLEMLGESIFVHGFIFVLCTIMAIQALRFTPGMPTKDLPPSVRMMIPDHIGRGSWDELELYYRENTKVVTRSGPVVCDPALLWKEAYHGSLASEMFGLVRSPKRWWTLLACVAGLLAVFVCLYWARPRLMPQVLRLANPTIRILTMLLATLGCVSLAFRAAGSMTRERDQNTLEGLLMLPGEHEEILRAKWLGSILRARWFGYGLLGLWILGLVMGALHPWAVLLLVAIGAAYAVFWAGIGTWLSQGSRNTMWANVAMALVLMLLFAGPWLSPIYAEWFPRQDHRPGWLREFMDVGLNPLRTWWVVSFSWTELADHVRNQDTWFWKDLAFAVLGPAILGGAALWLWWMTRRHFHDGLNRLRD